MQNNVPTANSSAFTDLGPNGTDRPTTAIAGASSDAALRFDGFEINLPHRRLVVQGQEVAVGGRAFELLLALAERPGTMVTKDELIHRAWPEVVVEENNLHVQVSALRRLVGDHAISTVVGRGYCLVSQHLTGRGKGQEPQPAGAEVQWQQAAGNIIGRSEEVATALQLLRRHRLVTVIGPVGIGKSMLAAAAAAAATAGPTPVCKHSSWVDLHLHVDATRHQPTGTGQRETQTLLFVRPTSSTLFVVDGTDAGAATLAEVVSRLLQEAPAVRVLATGPVALGLEGERVLTLGPLTVPKKTMPLGLAAKVGAVALFIGEAQAADHRFLLTRGNVEAVVEMCRALEGHPLAIKLAAQHVQLLTAKALRHDLIRHLYVLRNAHVHAPERHRSLAAAAEWSLTRIDNGDRELLCRLSALDTPFTLEQAITVLGDQCTVGADLASLSRLVHRSLVVLEPDEASSFRVPAFVRHHAGLGPEGFRPRFRVVQD